MSKQELEFVLSTLESVLKTDRNEAFTMPGEFYTSEALLDVEREQLFRKKWLCVGREEELPEVGDFMATELVGEPIVLVRTKAGSVKALSNVCRHRALPLVEGKGNSKRFTCAYHAWTYDLDGQLVSAHGVEDQHKTFMQNCRLPEFNCEIWHGFIFVNLDMNADSFLASTTARQIEPMVENMHIADMRLLYSSEQEWEVNWKNLVENFLEGYHLSTVHRKTLHPFTPTRLSKHFDAGDGFFGFYSYYPEEAATRGGSHPDLSDEERRRSLMLGIGPSSVFGISGFKVTYNLIQPLSATRLRTRIGMVGIPPENEEEQRNADAGVDLFTRTFAEDEVKLLAAMRGLHSRFYTPSVLAKPDYEGTLWDFYNYLARNISR